MLPPAAASTMPAQPRRQIDDDPWGFGAPDGTLVEVKYDPQVVTLGRVTPECREARERPTRAGAYDPAGDARLEPEVATEVYRDYFRPRRRRPRLVTVALALGLAAAAGGGVHLWLIRAPLVDVGAPPRAGTLVLSSQPAGAEVLLDGIAAGRTPLALSLTPGAHSVVATAGSGVSQRITARVPAGESASHHLRLDAPEATAAAARPDDRAPTASPAVPGYVTFDLPFDARIHEGDRLLGSTSSGRLRVAPGRHTFTLVSDELGFRSQETMVIEPGRSTRHVVEQRSAPLSVEARPWAEVFISGRSWGETPLADIRLPIGTYQVTLRHPTLGEREVAVTVRLGAPNRLTVDMQP